MDRRSKRIEERYTVKIKVLPNRERESAMTREVEEEKDKKVKKGEGEEDHAWGGGECQGGGSQGGGW